MSIVLLMNKTASILKMISISFLFLIAIISICLLLVHILRLDSSFIKRKIEHIASSELNRKVSIEGNVNIHYGLWPSITVNKLNISNPKGWETESDFIDVGSLKLHIGIIPLLNKKIVIHEIALTNVNINLERVSTGKDNWNIVAANYASKVKEEEEDDDNWTDILKSLDVNLFRIENLNVVYTDNNSKTSYSFDHINIKGSASLDSPVTLSLDGDYKSENFNININAAPLNKLTHKSNWPVNLNAAYIGSRLNIDGEIVDPIHIKGFDTVIQFEATQLERLTDIIDLPTLSQDNNSISLETHLRAMRNSVEASDIYIQVGDSELVANFNADLSKDKPSITGEIDFKNLDINPFLEETEENEIETENFSLSDVLDITKISDADIEIFINNLEQPIGQIKNIRGKIEIQDNRIHVPIGMNFEDLELSGRLRIGNENATPEIFLELASNSSSLNKILSLFGAEFFNANLGLFKLNINGKGNDTNTILKSLNASLLLNDLDIYTKSDRQNSIYINSTNINIDPGGGISGRINGYLSDEPISVLMSACAIGDYITGKQCPISLKADRSETNLNINGRIRKDYSAFEGDINLDLEVNDLKDYEKNIGVHIKEDLPLKLTIKLNNNKNDFQLRLVNFTLGRTKLKGNYVRSMEEDYINEYIVLQSDVIDLNQIIGLVPKNKSNESNIGNKKVGFDIPVIPSSLETLNSEVDIDIKHILLGKADFKETRINFQMSKGKVKDSRIVTFKDDTQYKGQISVDMSGEDPMADLLLSADDVDVGSLLSDLGFHDSLYVKSEKMKIEISLIGRSLREIINKSAVDANIVNGSWRIFGDIDTEVETHHIEVPSGRINVRSDTPITINVDAVYNKIPIKFEIETDNILRGLLGIENKSPVKLDAQMLDVNMNLSGWLTYPLGQHDLEISMNISGNNLNSMNDIFNLQLPSTGPYSVKAIVNKSGYNYQIHDLEVMVGKSAVNGKINYITSGEYQKLDINIYSSSIELLDIFNQNANIEPKTKVSKTHLNKNETKEEDLIFEPIISYLNLSTLQSDINIKIDNILFNNHLLGNLEFVGNLQNGHISINHFDIHTPGGIIHNLITADIIHDNIRADLVTKIESLEYGFLENIFGSKNGDGGQLSLDLNLSTYGDDLDEMDDHTSGYININVLPKSVSANIFDLWATNILFNMLPKWSGKTKSEVNCIVGNLKFTNGIIDPDEFYIDTTNVRVRMNGHIDLRNQWLSLIFKPIPKRPQLFDLGIPIGVTGEFNNYKINPDVLNIGWYVVRVFYTSMEYILKLFGKDLIPEDGSDICSRYVDVLSD